MKGMLRFLDRAVTMSGEQERGDAAMTKYFAGIDLGKRKSHIKIITQERKVMEDLKISKDHEAFRRIFRKYKGDIEAACEASSNAFWVVDTLTPLVSKIHVGDTKKIRWIRTLNCLLALLELSRPLYLAGER
jgi:hypothetical protein